MAKSSDDPRQSLPPPPLEDLQAYADGRLDPARVADLELYLALHPDYQALVETYRAPDLRLQAAYAEKLEQLMAAEQKTTPAFWRKWVASIGSWFQTPMRQAGLAAALVLLLVLVPWGRESVRTVPELGDLPSVRGAAPAQTGIEQKSVGEPLLLLPPESPLEQILVFESDDRVLRRIDERPPRAQVGQGTRFLIALTLEAGADAAQVEAVLQGVVNDPAFSQAKADRRSVVLEALESSQLSPKKLRVIGPYAVEDQP